jgi:hypothetical protein
MSRGGLESVALGNEPSRPFGVGAVRSGDRSV